MKYRQIFLGIPGGSAGKESSWNVGDLGSIPGLRKPAGEGKGYPLWYFGLKNSMNCIVSPWGGKESNMTLQFSLSLFITEISFFLYFQRIYIHLLM